MSRRATMTNDEIAADNRRRHERRKRTNAWLASVTKAGWKGAIDNALDRADAGEHLTIDTQHGGQLEHDELGRALLSFDVPITVLLTRGDRVAIPLDTLLTLASDTHADLARRIDA